MNKFKVFTGGKVYSIVEADWWSITSEGAANFFKGSEIVLTFDRNEWFFVEVTQ